MKLLGKAWSLHSLGALSISIPNNAFDPAQKQIVSRERYLKRKSEFQAKIEAFKAYEAMFTGQTTSPIIEWLESEIQSLGAEPEKSLVVRPTISGMNELQSNFNALLDITVKGERIETTLQAILARGDGYQMLEKSTQEALSKMIEKLREKFPLYRDFLDPIFGYIYSLKLGLSLASMEVNKNRVEQGVTLNPTQLAGNTEILTEEGRNNQDWLIYQLSALSTQRRIELPTPRPETTSTMREIFDKLFWTWRERVEKEKAEAAAASSLFKYKGVSDEDDEAEFRRMFPEEVLEDDDVMADTPAKKPVEEEQATNQPHKELASKIAKIQAAAFADVQTGTDPLEELLTEASELFAKSTGKLSNAKPAETFAAGTLMLKHTDEYLRGKTKMDNYDFYQDENLEEAWRLVKLLESVLTRFQVLHEAWPEHVTIQDVIDYSKEIAAMPNSTPIAKFLSRLERLHQTVHEWQTLASTEFTSIDQFNALTELIVSWRRLELQAWPKLLKLEEARCEFETQSFWFFLYESIIGNSWIVLSQNGEEELSTHIAQLTIALCAFLTSASIGQYKHRLDMLLVFQKYIEEFYADSTGMLRIATVLKNVINYFSEYTAACAESIAATKKKIEKDVSEVVLLASWKDTNIVALRESANRSHHKLFKVIRRYRDSLGASVQGILMGTMAEVQIPQMGALPAEATFEVETLAIAQKICGESISTWTSKPKRLIELQKTTKFMTRILTTADDALDVPYLLESFVSDTKETIKTLQKETPGTLTEENKDVVKHLKSRKRKAYTDGLKALRHMGLRSNLSAATMDQQKTTEKILASLEPIESKYIETTVATKLFNRVLEYIQKVRRTPNEHSADLTGQEVARSVGYIEHLLNLEIEQRKNISSALKQFDTLEDTLKKVKKVSGLFVSDDQGFSLLSGQPTANAHSLESMKRRVKWLPRIIQFAVTVLKAHVSLRGNTYDKVGGLLLEYLQKSQILRERLNGLEEITDSVWTQDLKRTMDEASEFLVMLRNALNTTIRKEIPELVYIADLVLPWTTLDMDSIAVEVSGAQPPDLLDSSLQTLCDSIFVALQRLGTAFSALPTNQDDQGWLLAYNNATSQSLKSLAIYQVSKLMGDVLDKISQLGPFTPQSSRLIEALLTAHEPILSTYRNICFQTIERALNLHQQACRLSNTLSTTACTLATNGFCTPPEKSDEKGPGEPQGAESGTGLADGEGMEDISKDIGADEDMEELAQEKKKDEDDDDKDVEENDDAVSIEGDMDGDMQDVEEKEEEDKDGDKNGEEGEQEMDEETGNVDDLDPGAVDEKMWDGEEEEDARDKEGGPNDKQEQGTDDVTAKTEDNKQSKEPQKGDNDEAQEEFPESDQEDEDGDEETKGNEGKEVQDDEGEQMDPHAPEVETLDLPEDMELDGGQDKDMEDDEDDDFGDMGLDDPTDLDKETEEDSKDDDKKDDGKTEEFPEVDMKDKEDVPQPEGAAEEEQEGDDAEKNGQGEAEDKPEEENGETEPQTEDAEPLVEQTEDDEKIYAEKEQPEVDDNMEETGAGGDEAGQTSNQSQMPSGANQQEQQNQEEESKEGAAENQGENADEQSGTAQTTEPMPNAPNQDQNQQPQQQAQDPFKKLGDVLEKFRKQQQDIQNAKQEEEAQENKPDEDMVIIIQISVMKTLTNLFSGS